MQPLQSKASTTLNSADTQPTPNIIKVANYQFAANDNQSSALSEPLSKSVFALIVAMVNIIPVTLLIVTLTSGNAQPVNSTLALYSTAILGSLFTLTWAIIGWSWWRMYGQSKTKSNIITQEHASSNRAEYLAQSRLQEQELKEHPTGTLAEHLNKEFA